MANRSFEMYEYRQALLRMRQGATDREIGRSGLMGRKKAGKVRELAKALGWLDREVPLPADAELAEVFSREPAPTAVSPLETHREVIEGWWKKGFQKTAIYGLLKRKHKYQGSYSSVRRFVGKLEPPSSKATMRLVFDPGEAAQVDFGAGPKLPDPVTGELCSTWIFVMTLCWSRHQYAEIVWNQKTPTWLACHQRAFRFFGGVPRRVVIDNAACAITRACQKEPAVQRSYYELAEAYGFRIDPCAPRRPELKGRVEAGVKYVKRSFLPGRDFRDLADANRQLEAWVLEEAGHRIHGTTRERPLTRFAEIERELLLPLPERVFEPAEWKQLTLRRDGHIGFDGAFYSAPWVHIAEKMWVRATATMVQIYSGHELVATHTRCQRPGETRTVVDHLSPEARAFLQQSPAWCREQAERVGPSCHILVELLLAEKVVERLPAAKGILRLEKEYGQARLESACQRALAFDDPTYRTVQTILRRGLDQHAVLEDAFDGLCDTYTGAGRFTRDTTKLLSH